MHDGQVAAMDDDDVDTLLGLHCEASPELGGAQDDSISVAVSAITALSNGSSNPEECVDAPPSESTPATSSINSLTSSSRTRRESDTREVEQEENEALDPLPEQSTDDSVPPTGAASANNSAEPTIVADDTGRIVSLPPGAYRVAGPGAPTSSAPVSSVSSDNQNDSGLISAVAHRDIANATDPTVAEPVPEDEPHSIGIRLHNSTEGQCSRRSSFDSFQAIVLDAAPVLEVGTTVDTCHPNQHRQELNDFIKSYYWQRLAFRICCLMSILAVGLGLGLGLSSSGQENSVTKNTSGDNLIITLQGEYEGQRMGSSIVLTKGAETILVGSPEDVSHGSYNVDPTGGIAQVFFLNRTTFEKNEASNSVSDDIADTDTVVTTNLLFETQGDSDLDHAGISVSATPFGEAIAVGYSQRGGKEGYNYVKVFGRNRDNYYTQIGDAIYGENLGDGFASSIALAQMHNTESRGLILLVGSFYGGYAQLWAAMEEEDSGQYTPWSRLDENDIFHHKVGDASDVVVAISNQNLFLGSPEANNKRGVVRMYSFGSIARNPTNSSLLTAEITEEDDNNLFIGVNEDDRFGSSISTDKFGDFVVIGGAGYARALHRNSTTESWRVVGNNDIEAPSCSSVATGRVSAGVPCRGCPNDLNATRIAIASSGKAVIYQFNEDRDDWVQIGDSIVASDDNACNQPLEITQEMKFIRPDALWAHHVSVAMSIDSMQIAVTCPASDENRGRVSIYNILPNEGSNPPRSRPTGKGH